MSRPDLKTIWPAPTLCLLLALCTQLSPGCKSTQQANTTAQPTPSTTPATASASNANTTPTVSASRANTTPTVSKEEGGSGQEGGAIQYSKNLELPPLTLDCQQADDCETSLVYIDHSEKGCCQSCTYKVASRAWVARVDAICQSIGYGEGCPQKKCVAPPKFDCIKGRCQAVEPSP